MCEVLLKWLDRRRLCGNELTEPCRYLSRIRWSAVDAEYVRTTVLHHAAVKHSPQATQFVRRVITFQTTGAQFNALQTSHRLASKLERCIVAVIGGSGSPFATSACAVSTQLTGSVEARFGGDLPFSGTALEAAAAVVQSTLYVVGVGTNNDQIWAYEPSYGWRRCCGGWSGLVAGRRRHSTVPMGGQFVYTVAGYCPLDRSLVSYVERFSICDNRNVVVDSGNAAMPLPVLSAGATAHGDDIYVFGGTSSENEAVRVIQV